jgi:cell division protein FtsI/penicillin-binding protein 2
MVSTLRRLTLLFAGLALVGALPACSSTPKPDSALNDFLSAWGKGKIDGLSLLTAEGTPMTGAFGQALLTNAEGDLAGKPVKLTVKNQPVAKKNDASATVEVTWTVATGVPWTYETTVAMQLKDNKTWKVVLTPKTIQPDLTTNDKMSIRSANANRGGMLDGAGNPIVSTKPIVTIGVEPKNIVDINQVVKNLNEAFTQVHVSADLSGLPAQVKNAKPDAFVEIITLRKEVFDQIAQKINSTPGTVTRNSTSSLAPSAQFARALLGTSGPVTKEIIDKNPGKYKTGDVVGLSGLQQKYDTQLRGTPGISVVIPQPTGTPDKKLFSSDPKDGTTIKTTLDVNMQNAAEAALTGTTQRSAMVVIKISTNQILAVANGPGAAANNFALTGQVPPGSMLKTVTALGVLTNGSITSDTTVACPATLTVDGRTFKNAGNEAFGNVPFHQDFAQSCNTAFASLAPKLGPTGLSDTAKTVGIGIPWDLGADVFTGKVSANGSASEQAAAAFGQGTTVISPVVMAAEAAAIARGQWKQPALITDPAPTNPAPDGQAFPAAPLDQLRTMMREVVTVGTAKQLKGLSGDLRGKTGTAEYDNDPTHTHSWFMGYRGDLAFCVFVENGGASTAAAVPIAGSFFQKVG